MFNAMQSGFGVIAASIFPATCSITRRTKTVTTSGGTKNSEAVVASGVPVLYRPASGSEVQAAGKTLSTTAYVIRIPASFSGALVTADARTFLTASAIGDQPALTFQIQTVERDAISIRMIGTLEA